MLGGGSVVWIKVSERWRCFIDHDVDYWTIQYIACKSTELIWICPQLKCSYSWLFNNNKSTFSFISSLESLPTMVFTKAASNCLFQHLLLYQISQFCGKFCVNTQCKHCLLANCGGEHGETMVQFDSSLDIGSSTPLSFVAFFVVHVAHQWNHFAAGSPEWAPEAPDWGEVWPPDPADGLSSQNRTGRKGTVCSSSSWQAPVSGAYRKKSRHRLV